MWTELSLNGKLMNIFLVSSDEWLNFNCVNLLVSGKYLYWSVTFFQSDTKSEIRKMKALVAENDYFRLPVTCLNLHSKLQHILRICPKLLLSVHCSKTKWESNFDFKSLSFLYNVVLCTGISLFEDGQTDRHILQIF